MSKKKIEAALRRKGLSCSILEYNLQATPGEMVGGWEVQLDERSEGLVDDVDPDFELIHLPEFYNATEVLEWVETLPDCRTPPAPVEREEP